MKKYQPEAENLNQIIRQNNTTVYSSLSEKGKAIFFPTCGILNQGKEAKNASLNATIGMALQDNGSPLRLKSISNKISIPPEQVFPYAPSYGLKELRKKWKNLILSKNPSLDGQISLPIVTNGLTHGVYTAGFLFADPGDKIILSNMYWDNYNLVLKHGMGTEFITFNIFKDDGFDTKSLEKTLHANPGKQILILNFPNNPTGYTLTEKEAEKIKNMILVSAENGNRLIVILDDAYFGLVYEKNILRESLFSVISNLHENILAIKIDGATKEDYAWGFRIGFITFACKGIRPETCKALEDKAAGVIRSSISNVNHISQSLLLQGLKSQDYQQEKLEKFNLLKSRYLKVRETLDKNHDKYSRYFGFYPFNSGYFLCLNIKNTIDTEILRKKLLNEHSIGVVANNNYLRIAFSCVPEKKIPELFNAIYEVCRELIKA